MAKSSASRSGCHMGLMLKPQPKLEVFGNVGQVYEQQQQVGYALVPFALKVVFGGPERVVAVLFHFHHDGFGLIEHAGQMLIRQPPVVDRRSRPTDVVQVHVSGEQGFRIWLS